MSPKNNDKSGAGDRDRGTSVWRGQVRGKNEEAPQTEYNRDRAEDRKTRRDAEKEDES